MNRMKTSAIAAMLAALVVTGCSNMSPEQQRRTTGQVLGGVTGAALGSLIGGGTGRSIAIGAGAVTGAIVGGNIADR